MYCFVSSLLGSHGEAGIDLNEQKDGKISGNGHLGLESIKVH